MKKKMNKVFMVCLAATAMTAGMSVSAFAQVHIGGTTYSTFDDAVAAAADGAVIVLDTDETTSGLNLSKNLTVDGGTDKRTEKNRIDTIYGRVELADGLRIEECRAASGECRDGNGWRRCRCKHSCDLFLLE